jgi:phosphoenolpyruvate-protein kinase (PTS system EI component)
MSEGFNSGKVKVTIDQDEVQKLLKEYKKIKKYMKSPLFTVKTMDGTEKIVSSLLKEAEENPINE